MSIWPPELQASAIKHCFLLIFLNFQYLEKFLVLCSSVLLSFLDISLKYISHTTLASTYSQPRTQVTEFHPIEHEFI